MSHALGTRISEVCCVRAVIPEADVKVNADVSRAFVLICDVSS